MGGADEGAGAVEQVDKEEDEDNGDHAAVEQAVEVHGQKGGLQAGDGGDDAFEFGLPQRDAEEGYGEDAEDDRAAHAQVVEEDDEEEAEQGEQHRPVGAFRAVGGFEVDIVHFHQRGVAGYDNAGVFQGDKGEEEADTGGDGHFQAHGQGVDQHFAQFEKAEQ